MKRSQRRIDNGNHLLLSGNAAVQGYLRAIGAGDRLSGPERAAFTFLDLASGERWTVRPNAGRLPWWIFDRRRRAPGSRAGDYLRALRLARAGAGDTVFDCLGRDGVAYTRFWEPLAVGVLNATADEAAAALLWPVLKETFARGESACRPRVAAEGLSETFVEPALSELSRRGARVRLQTRVRGIAIADGVASGLELTDGETVALGAGDAVIVAVPPAAATALRARGPGAAGQPCDRQRPFPPAAGVHRAGDGRTDRRAGALGVLPRRRRVGDGQRRRRDDRPAGRRSRRAVLAGGLPGPRIAVGAGPAGAHRQGKAGNLRANAGRACAAARMSYTLSQRLSGRRLDRHRPAGDSRRECAFRQHCGRTGTPNCTATT